MKNILSPLYSLVAGALCTLALGSCSRAEYAMLPPSSSYLGTTRAVATAPARAAQRSTVALETTAPKVASEAVAEPETPVEARTPATPVAKTSTASSATDEAEPANEAAAAAVAAPVAAATVAQHSVKMTRVQKFAASKALRTLNKAMGVTQFKEKLDVAKTQKISGNLRTGIILLLIALIVSLFSRVNSIFGLIGTIIAIIGLIFIVLWLLDNI